MRSKTATSFAATIAVGLAASLQAAPTITQRPMVAVPTSTTDQHGVAFNIGGMSGVTWRGGNEFIVALDNSDKLVRLSITFNPDGSISGLSVLGGITIGISSDHEGAAFTDGVTNSVFLASEVGPSIREFSLTSGAALGTPTIPAVFTAPGNLRTNFGFESLTIRGNAGDMWTANEEALVPDGPLSSQSSGSLVRLTRFAPGSPPIAAQQFAYLTQPWHGTAITGNRSGVSDLVALPSGKLLVLERSLAFNFSGLYKNSIFLADFAGASDVSALAGLAGQTFTPIAKSQLWTAFLNQNLEGLCLGPRLPSGRRVLVGVVDAAAGDPVSTNSAISFELDDPPACPADYNGSGSMSVQDLFDFLRGWFARNPLADLNGSGTITVQDLFDFLTAWFGSPCP